MVTTIGATLKDSPRLLWFMTLSAVMLVGADMACVAFLDWAIHLRFTLALIGLLICAFLSTAQPPAAGRSFGFRVSPRQGWIFWIKATAIVGVVLFVILLCAWIGGVALGISLPVPRLENPSQFV
jgi:uncharacterized protein